MNMSHDMFLQLKNGLVKAEYPFIQQLTDDEIKILFNQANRLKFLQWVFTCFDNGFVLLFEEVYESQVLQLKFIELLYDFGLCRKTECKPFVIGHKDFTYEKQYPIFQRIFNKLIAQNINKTSSTISDFSKSIDEYSNDFSKQINNLIKIKQMIPQPFMKEKINNKQQQICAYKSELELLKSELNQNISADESNNLEIKFDENLHTVPFKVDLEKLSELKKQFFNNIYNVNLEKLNDTNYFDNKLISNINSNVEKCIQLFQREKDLNEIDMNKLHKVSKDCTDCNMNHLKRSYVLTKKIREFYTVDH